MSQTPQAVRIDSVKVVKNSAPPSTGKQTPITAKNRSGCSTGSNSGC